MATTQHIIAKLPIGKANAIKVPNLERSIGNLSIGTNNDITRSNVRKAILKDRIPIGSCSKSGYYIINSDAECQEVIDKINATIDGYIKKKIRS